MVYHNEEEAGWPDLREWGWLVDLLDIAPGGTGSFGKGTFTGRKLSLSEKAQSRLNFVPKFRDFPRQENLKKYHGHCFDYPVARSFVAISSAFHLLCYSLVAASEALSRESRSFLAARRRSHILDAHRLDN